MEKISERSGSMKEFERDRKDYHAVGKCIPKKDSEQLLLGKPVFMDDIVHEDCLVVKILRSPHAHALIEDINTAAAMKVPGIVAVYTWKDVPQNRFSIAGQTFPEPSPYDFVSSKLNIRCWNRCWISARPLTIRCWCIRKITGCPMEIPVM